MLPLLQRGSINLPPCWEPLPPQVDCRPCYCSSVPQHSPAVYVCHLWFISAPLLTLSYKHTHTHPQITLYRPAPIIDWLSEPAPSLFLSEDCWSLLLLCCLWRVQADGSRTVFLWGAERLDAITLCDVAETEGDTTHIHTQVYTGPLCHSECLCKSFDTVWWNYKNIYFILHWHLFNVDSCKTVEHVLCNKM